MDALVKNQLFGIVAALLVGLVLGAFLLGGEADHADHEAPESTVASEWTCSMHPQIRQTEPGDCPICGMDLVPVGTATAGPSSPYVSTLSPEAAALAGIVTTTIQLAKPTEEVALTGKVAVDERRIETISATFPGRVERLSVDFTGQPVQRGQRLATIYSPALITAQQELIEAAKVRGESPELYRAAREKLRLWQIEEAQIDAVEVSGRVQSEFEVMASATGIVLKRNVAVGDYVRRGSPLFEVADLHRVWVTLDAYEGDLSKISVGDEVTFEAASLPGQTFTSVVSFVDPVVNPVSRTARVRVETQNESMQLRPDVFVDAVVSTSGNSPDGLLVPKTAVLWTGPRSIVYVRDPSTSEPQFEMREVALGVRVGEDYVVTKGLEPGDEVVSRGAFAVDAATQLNGGFSMMERPDTKHIEVPDHVRTQIAELVQAYFGLKNALASDDAAGTSRAAGHVLHTLEAIDHGSLTAEAHEQWSNIATALRDPLEEIGGSDSIESARLAFLAVSNATIKAVDTFNPDVGFAYVQFCPMAADFEGAHWLSEVEEILNPYFGEHMLTCGDTVRPVSTPSTAAPTRSQPQLHRH